jgi:hypothetical protein
MIYVICAFGGLFVALSFAMLYVSYRERHVGMFIMGVTYGTSGVLAITLPHWWPIVSGFLLVWLLRFMGLEPRVEPKGDESVENAEPPSQVKDRN